jgi:RHS repeat-associated protein
MKSCLGPGCCSNPATSSGPIRLLDGAVVLRSQDVLPTNGGFFGHRRAYCNQPAVPYAAPNGFNWWNSEWPYAVSVSSSSVAIVFDSLRIFWFDKVGSTYVSRYSFLSVKLTEDTTAQTFTFVDNSAGKTDITVLRSLAATTNPGMFVSHTDWRGIETSIASQTGSQINELQRSYTISGTTTTESLVYSYFTSGSASGYLQRVLFRRKVGSDGWTSVQQVVYAYYGASDPNGSLNDLQSASQQLPDGSGGWNTVAVEYYRYWLAGASTGFAHGLKMHFGPEAYRLMFNAGINLTTASDSTVLPYADHYFEYNPASWTVTKEIAAVCPSCPGGGTTSDLFAYTSNSHYPGDGFNTWKMKTVQTLPDSSQIVVYTNFAGLAMLKVNIDPNGTNMWGTFYRYDSSGRRIWEAMPSAVAMPSSLSTLEANNDLIGYNPGTGLYAYLNNSTGLINFATFDSNSNLSSIGVQQGQSGSPISMASYTYTSSTDASGNTAYFMASSVAYPDAANPSITITTGFAYTWYSGTNLVQQKTMTPPVVGTAQNGSGTSYTIVENYDDLGNLTSRTDERGVENDYTYASPILGLLTEQVLNVVSGGTDPGDNLTTTYAYDNLGRLLTTTGTAHTVVLSGTAMSVQSMTWTVYNQTAEPSAGSNWGVDSTYSEQGYYDGTNYVVVYPVAITKMDKEGRITDVINSTTGTGSAPVTPSLNQSDWSSWTSKQYDEQHRTISRRTYFLIPSSGLGTIGVNYSETDYGYDALERRIRVAVCGGTATGSSTVFTITRTVWTTPQWVASVWTGTNDTGATDSNPAGSGTPNNMVMVESNVYDGGSAGGDGNLTQQTLYVSFVTVDTRVANYGYDFRDRRTSLTDATGRYAVFTLDNLNRQTQTQMYATNGGYLVSQSQTHFDDRNRIYQQLVYAVDPTTGNVGNNLTANNWYDPSGNLIQSIQPGDGQKFSKTAYNGVNWVTAAYTGYNTTGTSYSQANTVAGDIVVEQAQNAYDEVGNVVSQAFFQRLNDAPTSGTGSTGALSSTAQPLARISYSASWFDGIDRVIANGNYGAISSFTRPTTPPSSSATVLVNLTAYDDAGSVYQTTDPNGIINQASYDAAGRKVQIIEDFGTGGGHLNRTTQWTYTLDSQTATMTAINAATGNQTTAYTYGVASTPTYVARNDLLASITYPDSDVVSYTYNRQGQQLTITDQRGTVRTLYYDLLARLTNDCVTTNGSGTDVTVKQIITGYEIRGMVNLISSTDSASQGAGTVLNQVAVTYNSFGQLTEQQQDHGGAVSGSSPSVQYGYDPGSSGGSMTNEIRFTTLTYPNGRIITYTYGASGGTSDYLNRVDAIEDTTSGATTLAAYTYLGASAIIRITYPQPSVWLDLWGGTSGTFNGLDQFGRTIDQRWQNQITTTPVDIDRYQYGYDQKSNRVWKANVVGTAAVAPNPGFDEIYDYDNLDRLTDMQRGTLNSTHTGITGTVAFQQDWTLDPTGNWSNFTTAANGTTNLNQTRTANPVNEITNITETTGPTWIVPAYDPAGNTTTMPQVADPTQSFNATYDAWNRMTSVSDSTYIVAAYQYDGVGRRVVRFGYTSGTLTETRHFYFTASTRDVEQRVGTSPTMDQQNVWGIRYVDELICRDTAAPTRIYACHDANFNVTALSNSSGIVVQRFVYEPYGKELVTTAAWITTTDNYDWTARFQGRFFDLATAIYDFRHRCFSPLLGRWLQRDPVGYTDGTNLYAATFVPNGNDPFGLVNVQHHWLPQDFEYIFDDICGFFLDDYISFIDERAHRLLHNALNYNAYWVAIIKGSYKNGKIDCCFLAEQASVMQENTARWLKAYGWLQPDLDLQAFTSGIKTYQYRTSGATGPVVNTTAKWKKLTSPVRGPDCFKRGQPCIDPMDEINDYIKNNPIRNPESVEVGPYGDMPGTRSLNDPLLLMLLPLVIFGPAEGFLEEGVAAPACVGRPESPTSSQPVATPPPVQAPIPLRPAA